MSVAVSYYIMTVKSAIYILYVSRELCDLGDKYSAMVFVDECHATGLMGKTGRYISIYVYQR